MTKKESVIDFIILIKQSLSVLTAFLSEFVFKLLKSRYGREELILIVVFILNIFWIKFQYVIIYLFVFLIEHKDNSRWLKVWKNLSDLIILLLVFLLGQSVIALVENEILLYNISESQAIVFLIMLIFYLNAFVILLQRNHNSVEKLSERRKQLRDTSLHAALLKK